MLLAFLLTVCFALLLLLWRKRINRIGWAVLVAFAFLVSLLLAFVSVCSVWTPYVTNLDFHGGEFDGYFPWSKLSYPVYVSVYHTPFVRLLYDGYRISGNASYTIFLIDAEVMKVSGTFSYPPIFGRVRLSYHINFPLFNNGETFFIFLLTMFTLFNIIGTTLGLILTYKVLKRECHLAVGV